MDYIEADDKFLELVLEKLPELFGADKMSKFPKTMKAATLFQTKINALKTGIFDMIDSDNPYGFNVLFRCLIEHYIKFIYIFFRFTYEKSDDVGEEYESYCGAKEAIDYAASLRLSEGLIGNPMAIKADKAIATLYPKAAGMSEKELERLSGQFKYRSILRYLHEKFPEAIGDTTFLASVIPEYALLSSFIHGGPWADMDMPTYREASAIEKCKEKAGLAFLMSVHTFMNAAMMTLREFPENKGIVIQAKRIMDEYLSK